MNENKTKKMNITDMVLLIGIAIIVSVVVLLSLRGHIASRSDVDPVAVKYIVEVKDAEPHVLDYMKEGQTVYDNGSMNSIGEVVSIKRKTATVLVEDHKKRTIVEKEVNNKVAFDIEIAANGAMSDGGVKVEDVNILIGKGIDCVIGNALVGGTIISLDYEKTEIDEGAQK